MNKCIIRQNTGMDIAKDDFRVCLSAMSANGRITIRGSRTFASTYRGFREFYEWVGRKSESSADIHFTMEATGVYCEDPACFLRQQSSVVHAVLPDRVKSDAKSLDFKSKTDKIDARILVRFGPERELRQWQPISPNLPELKQLTRERDRPVRNCTAMSSQLHSSEHEGRPNRSAYRTSRQSDNGNRRRDKNARLYKIK